ncbi:MAG: DUF4231 domain-containing protein [Gemmatimonadota bacterium]|nr:MAG: DUF4231 domain-containing protein [Gemmatimonadota bacterium]
MASSSPVGADAADSYPTLKRELETAERILGPAFQDAGERALRYQERFRGAELTIIYGGVVAVALGAVAGLTESDMLTTTLAISEAVLAAALGSLAFVARSLKWHKRWLDARWTAETLRGERFLFVGRQGVYAGAPEPERLLRQRLVEAERLSRGAKVDV